MYKELFNAGKFIKEYDSEVSVAINGELERLDQNIELIASENIVSPAVLAASGCIMTNKYAEGYPGKRYYGGCDFVDVVETLAIERAKKIFGAEHANVQAHCGANANTAAYFALLTPGDTVLGLDLSHGGHLSHGLKVNISGKYFNFISYGVDDNGFIDMAQLREKAIQHKPKLIVAGASAYPRALDFAAFKAICDEVGALLMVDMAHIAGLVAAGVHASPIPFADVVTSTTHKTLRGPRGGLILCKEKYAKAIDSAIFPGTQGGPLEHIIAAKAICFKEALSPEFNIYQHQVVKNAAFLASELQARGINLVSGGTDNHLLLLDLRGTGMTGNVLQVLLDDLHITTNKNSVPNDPEKPTVTSGLRIGTPAVTTRGFKEPEMAIIAELLADTIFHIKTKREEISRKVAQLTARFPVYR